MWELFSKANSINFSDSDVYEFYIVSLDNKQWHFEASNSEERDDWVSAIEQQILNSLQLNESSKTKRSNNPMEATSIQSIRSRVPGNNLCVDCDAPSKFRTSIFNIQSWKALSIDNLRPLFRFLLQIRIGLV